MPCCLVNSCHQFLPHGGSDFPCEWVNGKLRRYHSHLRSWNVVQPLIALSEKRWCVCGWVCVHLRACVCGLHIPVGVFSLLILYSQVCFFCLCLSHFKVLLYDCNWHIVISILFPPLRALWFLQFDIHGLQLLPLLVITLPYLCPRGIIQINMKVFSRELSSSGILLLISERLPKPTAKPPIKGMHRWWCSLFYITLHPWSQLNRSKIGFCLKDSQSLHVLAKCKMAFSYERKPKSIK